MNKTPKNKLCWNCEASVSVTAEVCPYCGVSVVPATLDGTGHVLPYKMSSANDKAIPPPPYAQEDQEDKDESAEQSSEDDEEVDVPVDQFKNILLALLLLLGGSIFFLFGLMLVLFSQNGTFTLQWDSSYWYIYSALSLPLLFIGWRVLLKLDEEK